MTQAEIYRGAVAKSIIVAVTACAAWFVVSKGPREQASRLQAELASRESMIKDKGMPDLDSIANEIARTSQRLDEVRTFASACPEPLKLIERVRAAAQSHGVRVDRLDPSVTKSISDDIARTYGLQVEVAKYGLTLVGHLDRCVTFMESLERDFGLCRVESIRINPNGISEGDAGTITMMFEATHYRLKQEGAQ